MCVCVLLSWNTYVVDGHDVEELCKALWQAQQVKDKPTAIVAKTYKGKGLNGGSKVFCLSAAEQRGRIMQHQVQNLSAKVRTPLDK